MQDLVQCKDVFVKTIADIRPTSACEAFAVVKLLHTRCPLQFVQMLQLGAGLPPDNAPINAENKKALKCSNMILERPAENSAGHYTACKFGVSLPQQPQKICNFGFTGLALVPHERLSLQLE